MTTQNAKQPHSLEHAIWDGCRIYGNNTVETILEHLKPMTGEMEQARLKFNAITKIGYYVTVTIPRFLNLEIQAIAWEGEYGGWVANARAKTLSQALSNLHDQFCKFPDE